MGTLVAVGAQWGDEGKGKIVDWLATRADVVARFQGGNNAGHTLVVDGEQTVLHLVPAGVLRPGTLNLIGPGVVVDPRALIDELMAFATQPRFVYAHPWRHGDLVIWDNRCTMHRATPFESSTLVRDMRRATIIDTTAGTPAA